MTVQELIDKLQSLPETQKFQRVVIFEGDYGYDDVEEIHNIKIALNVNTSDYSGNHDDHWCIDKTKDTEIVDAIHLI